MNVGLDPFDNVNSNASLDATMQMVFCPSNDNSPLHLKFSFVLISLAPPYTQKLSTRNSVTAIPSSCFNVRMICVNMNAIL